MTSIELNAGHRIDMLSWRNFFQHLEIIFQQNFNFATHVIDNAFIVICYTPAHHNDFIVIYSRW